MQLNTHYHRGSLFENLIIAELIKVFFNNAIEPEIYYWRNNTGNEIDLLIETNGKTIACEINSSATYHSSFFKNLDFWHKISGNPKENSLIIYSGENELNLQSGTLLPWNKWSDFCTNLTI